MKDRTTPMGTMGTPPGAADEQPKRNLATEDMAINAKGEKVSADDPSAVTLIAAKGQPIPSDETIKAMGYKTADQRAADAGEPKADAATTATTTPKDTVTPMTPAGDEPAKKARGKTEDKAKAKGEDKGSAKPSA